MYFCSRSTPLSISFKQKPEIYNITPRLSKLDLDFLHNFSTTFPGQVGSTVIPDSPEAQRKRLDSFAASDARTNCKTPLAPTQNTPSPHSPQRRNRGRRQSSPRWSCWADGGEEMGVRGWCYRNPPPWEVCSWGRSCSGCRECVESWRNKKTLPVV